MRTTGSTLLITGRRLVENVKRLRFAAEGGAYGQLFKSFNDAMAGH